MCAVWHHSIKGLCCDCAAVAGMDKACATCVVPRNLLSQGGGCGALCTVYGHNEGVPVRYWLPWQNLN